MVQLNHDFVSDTVKRQALPRLTIDLDGAESAMQTCGRDSGSLACTRMKSPILGPQHPVYLTLTLSPSPSLGRSCDAV